MGQILSQENSINTTLENINNFKGNKPITSKVHNLKLDSMKKSIEFFEFGKEPSNGFLS